MVELKGLESAARRVVREITAVRKQNRTLASQTKRLRRQLADLPAGGSAWDKERQELKKGLKELISTLESVLKD